jgi:hypothetical protein
MEIKPTHTTFEQAKLLKDKGFDNIECSGYYHVNEGYEKGYSFCHSKMIEQYNNGILAPEQWQVVEWLRVNHGIWILILPQDKSAVDFRIDKSKYPNHALFFSIIKYEEDCSCKELINTSDDKGEVFFHFDSPQEAYSAAFDYILNILI